MLLAMKTKGVIITLSLSKKTTADDFDDYDFMIIMMTLVMNIHFPSALYTPLVSAPRPVDFVDSSERAKEKQSLEMANSRQHTNHTNQSIIHKDTVSDGT